MPFSFNPLLGVGLDKSIPLDGAGKIPSTFLPSYVDDVEEYNNLAAFPATGETGKIYVAIDTGFVYRWSGSIYVQIGVTAAAGSTTQVQFNDGGAFGGDAGLVFDKTTDALTIAGPVVHPLGAAATPSLTFTGDPNTGIYSPGADQLAISTNGTGRLFVNSTGLVGLGTSTPGQQMVIRGSQPFLEIRDSRNKTWSAEEVFSGILFGTDDNTFTNDPQAFIKVVHTRAGAGHTSADAGLTFGTSASTVTPATERMRIDEQGRVGIGTTSPSSKLVVEDSSALKIAVLRTGTAVVGMGVESGPYVYSDGALQFRVGATAGGSADERARIDTSGRLLVGTSTARSWSGVTSQIQLEGTSISTTSISQTVNSTDANGAYLALGKSRGASTGSATIVQSGDQIGAIYFNGADGSSLLRVATIEAYVDGTPGANDMPGRLIFSTTSDGAASPTERLRITSAGVLQVADAGNITVGTTTGTKIGTATTQKIGFYNATPVVQPAAVADATDAATVITQLNDLLAKLRTLGIIAT